MKQYIYSTFTFVIISCNASYGGNAMSLLCSQTNPTDPIEQIKQELNCSLQDIDVEAISTRHELTKRVETILNKDILDKHKFPQFNEYVERLEFKQNKSARLCLGETLCDTAIEFITQKSKQLPNDPETNFNCWPCSSMLASYFNLERSTAPHQEYDV